MPTAVNTVTIAPNGEFLVAGYNTGQIKVWSVNNGQPVYIFKPTHYQIKSLTVSDDSKYVLSGSDDWTIRLWSMEEGTEVWNWKDNQKLLCNVAFSSDKSVAFVGGITGNCFLLNVETRDIIRSFTHNYLGESHAIAISANSKRALTGFKDGFSYFWNAETGELISTLYNKPIGERFGHPIMQVGFSADSKYAVTISSKIFIWDSGDGKLIKTFTIKDDTFSQGVHLNHSQQILAAAVMGEEDIILLIDLVSGAYIRTFKGHKNMIRSLAISRDDRYAFTGSNDGTARLWDIQMGVELYRFEP